LPEPIQDIGIGNIDDNNPVGVCVSPNGKFVYVGNANGVVNPGPMSIRGFKVGYGGILTLVPGAPYYPLGNHGTTSLEEPDPAVVATGGYPSFDGGQSLKC
jgi:DNA-binding beta-propeller fold protein YncE